MLQGAKITVTAASLAFALVLLGTALGVVRLGAVLGLPFPPTLASLHPRLQLFGFLGIFIAGVAYTLVPRLKNKRLPSGGLAYASLALLLLANLLWLLEPLLPRGLELMGNLALLAGSSLFAALLAPVLGRPSGVLAVSEPYIWLAVLSFPLTSLLLLIHSGPDPFMEGALLYLSLLGFPGSMIYGIYIRTIHFRDPFRYVVLRKRLALAGFLLQLAAVLWSLASLGERGYLPLASALFLAAGMTVILSIQGFRRLREREKLAKMLERDRSRYIYFSSLFDLALLWLLASLALGLLYSLTGHLALRDSFIHGLALGFMGNTIMAYVPILLPPMLTAKVPYKGLSRGPALLFNAASLWRLLAYGLRTPSMLLSWLAWLAGPLLLLSMAWFLLMVASLRA